MFSRIQEIRLTVAGGPCTLPNRYDAKPPNSPARQIQISVVFHRQMYPLPQNCIRIPGVLVDGQLVLQLSRRLRQDQGQDQ